MTALEQTAGGEVLAVALELAAAGYALTPVRMDVGPDGRKKPQPCLKGWRSSTDPDQIRDWFAQFSPNVWAQVCAPSGVDVVDLDVKADGPTHYLNAGLPDSTMVVDTPGGGRHYLFAADAARPLGVTAGRLPGVDTRSAGSDTKGGISFIVGVLPDGRRWRPRVIVPVSALPATPDALRPLFAPTSVPAASRSSGTRESSVFAAPGRTFTRSQALKLWNAQLADIEAIAHLQGARHTTLVKVSRALGIFDGAVPDIREATWGRLRLALEGQPGVDIGRAQRTFEEMWACATDRADVVDDPPADPFGNPSHDPSHSGPTQVSTGLLVDLTPYLDDDYEPETAGVGLERDDGPRLLYAGKWSTLIGETGIGKSWLALWHCVEEMRRGNTVLYAHFEEATPRSTVLRLRQLGMTPVEIAERFRWLDGAQRPTGAALAAMLDEMDDRPTLAVLDGINAACGAYGWDPLAVDGVNAYRRTLVAPLTAAGVAVLSVGHPPKSRAAQGERHGYGSSAWLDLVDGVGFRVKQTTRPIRPGVDGYITLFSVKDRAGGVERHGRPEPGDEGVWTYLGAFHVIPPQSELGNVWCRLSSPASLDQEAGEVEELELTDDVRRFRWLARQGVKVSAGIKTIARSLREAPKGSVGPTNSQAIDELLRRRYAQWWTDCGEEWLATLGEVDVSRSVPRPSHESGTWDESGTKINGTENPPWSDDVFSRPT